jgi:hypothetical protein
LSSFWFILKQHWTIEEISSIVRRKNPDNRWRAITHQIFEVPNQEGGLLDRLKVLQDPSNFSLITQPTTDFLSS